MRLRNDSGYPLNSSDLGRVIPTGPEEFESPVYITGCTRLDPPADDDLVGDEDDNPSPGMQEASNGPHATEGVETPEAEAREHAGEHVDEPPADPPKTRTGRRAARTGDQA